MFSNCLLGVKKYTKSCNNQCWSENLLLRQTLPGLPLFVLFPQNSWKFLTSYTVLVCLCYCYSYIIVPPTYCLSFTLEEEEGRKRKSNFKAMANPVGIRSPHRLVLSLSVSLSLSLSASPSLHLSLSTFQNRELTVNTHFYEYWKTQGNLKAYSITVFIQTIQLWCEVMVKRKKERKKRNLLIVGNWWNFLVDVFDSYIFNCKWEYTSGFVK